MMETANLCRWMNRAVFSLGADPSGALSQLSSVKLSAIEVEKRTNHIKNGCRREGSSHLQPFF